MDFDNRVQVHVGGNGASTVLLFLRTPTYLVTHSMESAAFTIRTKADLTAKEESEHQKAHNTTMTELVEGRRTT